MLYVAVPASAPNMDGVMETLSVHLPSLVRSLKQTKATVSGTASALVSARVATKRGARVRLNVKIMSQRSWKSGS